jgi:hypothetical protein
MVIDGNTTCAVPGCGAHISGPNNLRGAPASRHERPRGRQHGGDRSLVRRALRRGRVILLNDLALGEIFGGAGFEAKLHEQAFVNVRNLATPEELEAAAKPAEDTKVAAGPAVRAGSKKPSSNSNRNTKE